MSAENLPEAVRSVVAEGERLRFEFLEADLELCFTFANLVRTKLGMGYRETAEVALSRAEEGYTTILGYLARLNDREHQAKVQRRLAELRLTLDTLHSQLRRK